MHYEFYLSEIICNPNYRVNVGSVVGYNSAISDLCRSNMDLNKGWNTQHVNISVI